MAKSTDATCKCLSLNTNHAVFSDKLCLQFSMAGGWDQYYHRLAHILYTFVVYLNKITSVIE